MNSKINVSTMKANGHTSGDPYERFRSKNMLQTGFQKYVTVNAVEVKLLDGCNRACTFCVNEDYIGKASNTLNSTLFLDSFFKWFDDPLEQEKPSLLYLTGGEPLLVMDIVESIVRPVAKRQIATRLVFSQVSKELGTDALRSTTPELTVSCYPPARELGFVVKDCANISKIYCEPNGNTFVCNFAEEYLGSWYPEQGGLGAVVKRRRDIYEQIIDRHGIASCPSRLNWDIPKEVVNSVPDSCKKFEGGVIGGVSQNITA